MTRARHAKTSTPTRTIARVLVAGLIGAAALFAVGPAPAQTMWIDRAEVVKRLGTMYAEAPSAMGVASNGGVMELFTAPDGETWTLVLTMPNGLSRIIAAGEGWTAVPITVAGRTS